MSSNNSPPTAPVVATGLDAPAVGLSFGSAHAKRVPFSPREQQVVELIAQGLSNREIGLALGICYPTVKVHVRRVYAKIGVNSRVAAVLWTVQNLNPNGRRPRPKVPRGNGQTD